MALYAGLPSGAICKPHCSPRMVRRRGRGALVRCRAVIWTKEELERLDSLAHCPREQLSTDVIDEIIVPKRCAMPQPDVATDRARRRRTSPDGLLFHYGSPPVHDDPSADESLQTSSPSRPSPQQQAQQPHLPAVANISKTLIHLSI